MPPPVILLRADADAQIGMGHVMRCLALGQAWQAAGGRVVFLTGQSCSWVEERLRQEHVEIVTSACPSGSAEDCQQTVAHARRCGARWIAADGYSFAPEYQEGIRDAGLRLLVIDDYGHLPRYCGSMILNQNLNANPGWYATETGGAELLLGSKYVLLRREFTRWSNREPRAGNPGICRVLVTTGGADASGTRGRILNALALLGQPVEVSVVVGPLSAAASPREETADQSAGFVRFLPDPPDMPALMAETDIAIAAAGSTVWELCFMGVPALLLVTAQNQVWIAEQLDQAGAALNLGWAHSLDPQKIAGALGDLVNSAARRRQMSQAGRALVDGQGAARVVARMRSQEA